MYSLEYWQEYTTEKQEALGKNDSLQSSVVCLSE